ncbi:hypothetical protein Nepgr_029559 [Nepenthes gracilis]|uniref:Uncharacterized protein n=1 Tax=Nepenthes gracilis TaxID=150966 RepID=A0AAD3TEF4_NEPGR|nr:hypothetical protein Nepgr_029559 [Nepenthes gracilis]
MTRAVAAEGRATSAEPVIAIIESSMAEVEATILEKRTTVAEDRVTAAEVRTTTVEARECYEGVHGSPIALVESLSCRSILRRSVPFSLLAMRIGSIVTKGLCL